MATESSSKASRRDVRAQVELESERRRRLAVPAFAGGVLYLLSGIIISETLSGAPSVGLFQGLAPALSGVANPAVSPRAAEVKFASQHAFGLLAGSALGAISIGALTLILLMLLDSAVFRRPQTWPGFYPLVLGGGIALALVSIGHQVVNLIEAHNFAVGHNHTNQAVEHALTKGTANDVTLYVDLLSGLVMAAGVIAVALNTMRVGLLPRWMGFLGMLTGVLIFLPIGGELDVVPAFWMVMIGILLVGKWPNGEPPAWAAGEARPWVSQPRTRAPRGTAAQPALSAAAADASAPAAPVPKSSRRAKRKGRARR